MKRSHVIVFVALLALTFGLRMLAWEPNFATIGALALLLGAVMPSMWLAVVATLAVRIGSDAVLAVQHDNWSYVFYSVLPAVLIGHLVMVSLGRGVQSVWKHTDNPIARTASVPGGAVTGSIAFFLITNFAVWVVQSPANALSLQEVFTLAIPFFRTSVIADVYFSGAFFAGFVALSAIIPAFRRSPLLTETSSTQPAALEA